MKYKKIVTGILMVIFLISACSTPSSGHPFPDASSPRLLTGSEIPPITTNITVLDPVLSYIETPAIQIWNFSDNVITKDDLVNAAEAGLVIVVADSADPLPLELLAVAYVGYIGWMYIYQNQSEISDVLQNASDAISGLIASSTTYSDGSLTFSYHAEAVDTNGNCWHRYTMTNPIRYQENYFGACDEKGRKVGNDRFIDALKKLFPKELNWARIAEGLLK